VQAEVYVDVAHGQANGDISWEGGGASITGLSGFHGFQRLSGAVLVRTIAHHGSSKRFPLASFGTVYFSAAQVDGAPIGAGSILEWRMVNHAGTILAIASGLHDDGSFAVNWRGSL
jgi:hypothetical protein